MPKNRMIRTEIWTDDKFVSLTPLARLLFIGMWNHACDNGHLDDSALQLKMRVLPVDNCDVDSLVDEMLSAGMVTRGDNFLKVVNLSSKQPLDLRFLVLCDHCDDDPQRHYQPSDKKPSRGTHASGTSESRERTTSARRSVDVVGGVDGDGGGKAPRRAASSALPDDWAPTETHQKYATTNRVDLEREVFKFRNHAASNDRRQANWNAAFSTWLAKASEWAPPAKAARPAGVPEGW